MITSKDFFEAMYNHQYANPNGYVFITSMSGGKPDKITRANLKGLSDKIDRQNGKNDMFFTPNSFSKNENTRTNDNILGLNAFFVDIDFGKLGLEENEVLKEMEKTLLIEPSAIVRSGNGLHIYFFLKHLNLFMDIQKANNLKAVYNTITKNIAKSLEHIGGDSIATAPSNYLRIPNTYNCKSYPKMVEIIELNEDNIYDLSEVAEHYYSMYAVKNTKKSTKKAKSKVKKSNIDLQKLNNDRVDDLITIINTRNGIVESRHLFLRLAIYLNSYRVSEVNSAFMEPKKGSEIDSMVRYYNKKVVSGTQDEQAKYLKMTKWTNESLVKNLGITADEQKQLKTIIGKEESRLRDKLRKREVRKPEQLFNKTKKDLNSYFVQKFCGLDKNKEIADMLGVSLRSIYNLKSTEVNVFDLDNHIKTYVNDTKGNKSINKLVSRGLEDLNQKELLKVIKYMAKIA